VQELLICWPAEKTYFPNYVSHSQSCQGIRGWSASQPRGVDRLWGCWGLRERRERCAFFGDVLGSAPRQWKAVAASLVGTVQSHAPRPCDYRS